MMGEVMRWLCHLLAAFALLTCSGIGFLPGASSDEITDAPPDTAADDWTQGLTKDPVRDPTHDAAQDPTRDPTHYTAHDPTVDQTDDTTDDLTVDQTHDTTHDLTVDQTHDTTHDPTVDQSHDTTNDPMQDTTLSSEYAETSSSQHLETRNKTLAEKVTSFLDEVSGIEVLQKAYDTAAASGKITFGTVDGESLINEVATSLGDLLGKKVEALKAAVTRAEHLTQHYVWNQSLKSVDYLHANEINESTESFEFDSQYKQSVGLNNSSVHIPIDIFRGKVDILNAIAWTDGLDEVWRENKLKDPSLLWQYFGSQTGLLRTYPASKWKDNSTLGKLYDVRRRPWYTQGISSPKDMLILIERSGSSFGQGLELMKHSVRSIMETLGENDFVNIAQFSDKAMFATCFRTFVQATDRNKKMMISFLDGVTSNQVANYTKGFEFAFKQFSNFSSNNGSGSEGANCNQVIILFTDGGSEVPVEIFRKYNSDKKIRIFTFAVGPVTSTVPMATKQIGCMNRGYFYQIPAMGAIRSTVQDYLSILADPMTNALDSDKHIWTSVHNDSMQLGFAISVTMPVFNRSQDQNQTILGVMGVDVSLEEMVDALPSEKLGPTGYAFAINPNGIILFHPDLKSVEESVISPMIDFAEIEEDTPSKEQIRTEMIDQISNKVTITDFAIGLDENHAEKKQRTYHYTAISGTKFSVAVVLPDYVTRYVESTDQIDFNQDGEQLLRENISKIVIDFQKYCQYGYVNGSVSLDPASDMKEFLNNMVFNTTTCDSQALQQLLFDAYITSSLEEFWNSGMPIENQDQQSDNTDADSSKQSHNSSNTDDIGSKRDEEIISRFAATNNDFTRVFPRRASNFFENQLEPSKEAYYKRSVDNNGWIFSIYSNASSENFTAHYYIMATKAVTLKSNNYKIAVVGVQLTVQRFRDLFNSTFSECSSDLSTCYILDDGGFIVSSNDDDPENSVGQFLGHKDAEVMAALIDNNVFERHRKLYFQEICTEDDKKNAGFRLLPPFIYEILSLNWWTTASTWSYLSLMNIYSWLFVQVPDMVVAAKEEPPKEEQCIKAFFQYHLNDTDVSNTVECNNCTRSYKTFRLEGTNLLVVSVDGGPCGCSEGVVFENSVKGSDPLIFENDDGASCSIRVRYRRRPPCYKDNPYEPESHCSASLLTTTLHLCLMMLLLSMTLIQIL